MAPPGPIVSDPMLVGWTPNSCKTSPGVELHRATRRSGFRQNCGELLALETGAMRLHTALCPALDMLACGLCAHNRYRDQNRFDVLPPCHLGQWWQLPLQLRYHLSRGTSQCQLIRDLGVKTPGDSQSGQKAKRRRCRF